MLAQTKVLSSLHDGLTQFSESLHEVKYTSLFDFITNKRDLYITSKEQASNAVSLRKRDRPGVRPEKSRTKADRAKRAAAGGQNDIDVGSASVLLASVPIRDRILLTLDMTETNPR
jgi:hypothetical protein